jgi:protein SCO1/2
MSETISNRQRNIEPVVSSAGINRRILIAAIALTLALLVSFLFTRYSAYRNVQETFYGQVLVPAKEAFDFRLVDQDGKPFRLSQLRGRAVLFSFGFTHCPNVCPTTLSDLAKLHRALPEKDRERVQVLFVSVDPRRDRPEVMKKYVPYFDDSFVGLTGPESQIAEVAKAYGAFYEIAQNSGENQENYSVNHSAFTYLVTPSGKWKLIYNFDQLGDLEKMVHDIEQVLSEKS